MKSLRVIAASALIVLLHVAGTSGYTPAAYKWNTQQVPFYVNPTNADVPADAAEAAVVAGASAWGTQSNAAFSFYYAGRTTGTTLTKNRKNEIFFRDSTGAGMIAETYAWYDSNGSLSDADTVFYDGGFQFYTGTSGCSGGMYIEDIATHEFGHILGLAHSSVTEATMYYGIGYCSMEWRTLANDDLQGVEALYPSAGTTTTPNTAPSVAITAPTSNSSFDTTTAVTFAGSATDREDGTLSAGISWRSSLDGTLGIGSSVSAALSAGTHTITATVTDSLGASASTSESIVITQPTTTTGGTTPPPPPPPAPPPPTGITLLASGFKIKGAQNVDLSWSGAASAMIDVYRNGVLVTRTDNDGAYRDAINKKGNGSYRFKVCEAATTTCSGEATISF
jgi:hypothetical protein